MDLTLAEAAEQIYYTAECARCKRVRLVDLVEIAKQDPDMRLVTLRDKLRCVDCDDPCRIVATYWRSASTSLSMLAALGIYV